MGGRAAFQLAFFQRMGEGQEVEIVGIAQDLDRHLRVLGKQRLAEVGKRHPFPGMELALDHVAESIAAPPLPDGHPQVPVPSLRLFDAVNPKAKVPHAVALPAGPAMPPPTSACT